MGSKRQATTDLNHTNWNQDDEPVERGQFRIAPEEELKTRIIKKARRKATDISEGNVNDAPKSIFSNFSGFANTPASAVSSSSTAPFSFLTQLSTNNNKTDKKEHHSFGTPTKTKKLNDDEKRFASKASQFSFATNITNSSINTKTITTTTFSSGLPNKGTNQNITVGTIPAPITTTQTASDGITVENSNLSEEMTEPVKDSNSSEKMTDTNDAITNNNDNSKNNGSKSTEYITKIKVLNQQFTAWIKKHVDVTPLCLLTPVFQDYERHLKNIEEEEIQKSKLKLNEDKPTCSNTKAQGDNLFSFARNVDAYITSETAESEKLTSTTVTKTKQTDNLFNLGAKSVTKEDTTTSETEARTKQNSVTASSTHTGLFNFGAKLPTENRISSSEATPPTDLLSFGKVTVTNSDSAKSANATTPLFPTTDLFNVGAKKSVTETIETSKEKPTTSTTTGLFTFAKTSENKDSEPVSSTANIFNFGFNSTTLTAENSNGTGIKNFFKFGTDNTTTKTENKELSTKTNGFTFGTKNEADKPSTSTAVTTEGFSLGITASSSTSNTKAVGFSFGSRPLNFGNTQQPTLTDASANKEDDNDNIPPKAEFKQVIEDDAIYSKKCKVYVKKDGDFVDHGVGTLYLKPVKDSEKTQLLVRADTNLGNILVNLLLSDGIPSQRMGKNNVMMVCVPTPDLEKPTPMLLRVKTGEEADQLLDMIKTYTK